MSGLARRVYLQPSTGEVVIDSRQDVGQVLASNQAILHANRPTSKLWHSDYVLVGRIPLIELERWQKMGLRYWDPDDWKIIKRMLNSNEWSGLRTAPGRF